MKGALRWGKPLLGDVLVILVGLIVVAYLIKSLWHNEQAAKLQIRLGDKIYSTYSLDQNRTIDLQGPIGITRIVIADGRAR